MTNPLLPTSQTPLTVQDRDGFPAGMTTQWYQFFQSLAGPGGNPSQVALAASPWTVKPSSAGTVLVFGGTVSAIAWNRGRTTISTPLGSGAFPLANGDTLTISYTVAPTIWFLPQ